ncbi:MAG: sulfite exporter TauE/SafE family protein [Actinobacteria bacterium]|nr:sulfite exporter TauE/SafE family protein [Actinomycetota bacterium]
MLVHCGTGRNPWNAARVGWRDLVILAGGLAAGGINAVVGSGTLITFPILVGFGYPPVVANVSNTIGLVGGSATAIHGWRRELRGNVRMSLELATMSAVGAAAGAELLLQLPAGSFRRVAPVIIGIAVVLVVVQPFVARWVAEHRREGSGRPAAWIWLFTLAAGVYGGYFGAAQGVILIGVLGLALRGTLHEVNAIRNILAGTANLVGAIVFALVAPVNWRVALLIGVSSTIGGWAGSHVGRRLPTPVVRVVVVCVGSFAIYKLTR